jgi:putative hydrolase of the HAD superfamily
MGGGMNTPVLLALDVDGVLLDPDRGGRGPWQAAFSERFGVDAARLDHALFATSWAEVVVGRRSVESALGDALDALGWTMGVEAALRCWLEEDFAPDPAVVTAASAWAAAGTRLALVSNQEPRRARYLETRLAEVLPISGVAFSGDLGLVKSDPDFYVRAADVLGADGPLGTVVFLDDTAANVDAARRHGWSAVHFRQDSDWRGAVDAALTRGRGGRSAV